MRYFYDLRLTYTRILGELLSIIARMLCLLTVTGLTGPAWAAAPFAPNNLTATAVTSKQIDLAWTDNATTETDYYIESSPNGSRSWTAVITLAANVTSYQHTGLTQNKKYYYRIRCKAGKTYSRYSNTANATTAALAAPAALVATVASASQIDLAWTDNSSYETNYSVERSPNRARSWIVIGAPGANVTTYSSTGLTVGTTYYYRVRAYDGTNYSAYSTAVNKTIRTISTSAGANGTIIPGGTVGVANGQNQVFAIAPNSGYKIATLTVDGAPVATNTTYMFTNVIVNHTINATFSVNTFTITTSAGPNGIISPGGSLAVTAGSNQTFTITSSTGYHVSDTIVDGLSVGAVTSYTFSNVSAAHAISAVFSVSSYTITASTGPNGSINPSGIVIVDSAATQAFTMIPNPGYSLTSVMVDGASVVTAGTYSFINVVSNHTINAAYADITAPIGFVMINGGASATNNSAVELTLAATDAGSGVSQMQFSNDNIEWSTPEPYLISKNWALPGGEGDKTVYAKFEDGMGLWSDASSSTILLDTTPPVVSIMSPAMGATSNKTPLLTYAVSEGNVVVKLDGVPTAKISGDYLEPFSDGTHTVQVESTDAAGNAGFASVTFNVDHMLPVAPVVQSLSMGDYHVLAIKTDGTLWTWGDNEHGQLGDGTMVNKNVPIWIGRGSSWKSVNAGGNHSTALTMNGELWMWGYNAYGQLGDGSNIDRSEPVSVPTDPDKFWNIVSAGSDYTAAIRSDGTLWTWGLNDSGQLGDGFTTIRTAPSQIGTDTSWMAVAAGTYHTMALKSDGSLWAWGYNAYGEMGDGSTDNSASPLQIGQEKTWIEVAAGCYHTVALKSDGTLWAWGMNDAGQLGDGSTTSQATPVQIGMDSSWVAVAAGAFHTVALKGDGTLWAWGMNSSGQLGDGTTLDRNVPTKIATANWSALSGGMMSSAAVKRDGTVVSWGGNAFGQLGNGDSVNSLSPVQIGADANWRAASGGVGFSLALKINNTLWAWGDNSYGQLGVGTSASSAIPIQVGTEQNWDKISAGENHALAIKTDGSLWGWGHNNHGQIGYGSKINTRTPVPISPGATWFAVSAGKGHTLGIQTNGSLWAWGYNGFGQLGNGTTTDSAAPLNISGGSTWSAVTAGERSSYALRSDGTLWAWGAGDDGQLGNESWESSTVPVPVVNLYSLYVPTRMAISAGSLHVLAIEEGVFCGWGKNDYGQLTNGWSYRANKNVPMCPEGTWDWVQVAAGQDFSLGRKQDGTIWAWGNNDYGQLGDGTTVERHYPAQIGVSWDWALIAAGKQHTLAIKTDGTLWSWGYNGHGQMGTGDLGLVQQPTSLSFPGSFHINNDAALTKNRIVTVSFFVVDPGNIAKMQFSNDNSTWSAPVTYTISATWDLTSTAYGGTPTDGAKTVYAKLQDSAGNWSDAASSTITLDATRPIVIITSPVEGATYDALPILTYSVSDGLAEVGIGPVDAAYEAIPSGSFLHRYATGSDGWIHVSVKATDAAGNVGSASVKFKLVASSGGGSDPDEAYPNCNGTGKYLVGPSNFMSGIIVPPVGSGVVNIASPENFATVNGSKAIVKGAMDTAVPIKSVVVLVSTTTGSNTYSAQMNGKYFAAKVPVTSDAIITVIATDQNNMQHQDSVVVFVNVQQSTVNLLANPSVGISALDQNGHATLDVKLETTMFSSQYVDSYSWDFSGTGYNDLTCWSHSSITARYQNPGLYLTQVVVDTLDHKYRDSVIVNVPDASGLDNFLKSIWTGMKVKMTARDINGLIGLFPEEKRDAYRQHFTRLSAYLPQMSADMGELRLVKVTEWLAEYDLRTIRNGEIYSFQVLFMKDPGGAWWIRSF